ncbi:hypothetical protein VW23_007050 [Devosia insulae DS-56]|uniref:HEAT repeat domain-containing protein n=1 Tax=Devosia insulae DS-56 TaxID=1116389 RepID=A0A1E5XHJ1_9HYPH|nr:hypothetical protein [Devosia insulae]OEO27954.1 hypothetical protein VW23_007050 [Devosia insulae DS-56]
MNVQPLSRDEFVDALRKGMGRAVQHIRAHGDAGVEDLLLEAATRSLGYDPQCEGSRGDWLMTMLSLCTDPAPYHQAVLSTFPASREHYDIAQMADMLLQLAQAGSEEARRALYDKFDRQEFSSEWLLSHEIIALDGLDGLLHVARVLGRRLATDPDFWLSGDFLYAVREERGANAVDDALQQASTTDADIRRFCEALAVSGSEPSAEGPYALDAFLNDLNEGNRNPRLLASRFARQGGDIEHRALFERIEREVQPHLIARMLRVFAIRIDPPGGIERVLRFARHEDSAVRQAAIQVLRRFSDDRIAELSGQLLAAGSLEGIELLGENARPGDFGRVHQLLPSAAVDQHAHDLALSIVSTGRPSPSPEAADCLIWVYEHNPCSFCRQSAVDDLLQLGRLPEVLTAECLDDSMSEVREAAAASPLGERSGQRPG